MKSKVTIMLLFLLLSLLSTVSCRLQGLGLKGSLESLDMYEDYILPDGGNVKTVQGNEIDELILEAEDFTASYGKIQKTYVPDPPGAQAIINIDSGDWIMFENVDFGKDGKQQLQARVNTRTGGWIEIRLNALEGPMVGKCMILPTGGHNHHDEWGDTQMTSLHQSIVGVHSVYFVFVSDNMPDSTNDLFKINWFKFLKHPMTTTGNPLYHHIRTADPSAHVWPHDPDTLWLYPSHDPANATDYSTMDGYHVFSTKDMKHWTDHGEALHSRDVEWGVPNGWMWAPDACYKNGKYYFYFPHNVDPHGNAMQVGVAISDRPQGPFQPMKTSIQGTHGGDPACFMDDDGQSYLYFGQKAVAKLADNMIELAEQDRKVQVDGYEGIMEGVWMHKRNGIYYYSFTQLHQESEYSALYAMGKSPYGPFTNTRPLNKIPPGSQDHHSIVEFKGQWYYFYHVGGAGISSSHRRMVCADKLKYNDQDGSIQPIVMTRTGVPILS